MKPADAGPPWPWRDMDEDARFQVYRIGAHGSWWGALILTVILTVMNLSANPLEPPNTFQRIAGIFIVFLIGVGIALGSALARMRLADTIADVFETGLKVATVLQTNVTASACMVETDHEGIIQSVEHAEVIGWRRDSLIGRNVDILVPDRFLRQHQENFKRFSNGDNGRMAGTTINMPCLSEAGQELGIRLSIARLGETLLGTLVPEKITKDDYEVQR